MNKYFGLLTKIHFHPIFWCVAAIAISTGYFWELITLFVIVLVHELGHAIAARYFSWKIKKVMILPFGGVCEVDEHGNRPVKEELFIVAAGPLQHVWMAAAVMLLQQGSLLTPEFALMFQQFNLMVFIFNLLPIWPLDGGRFIQLLLAARKPFLDAVRQSLLSSFILLAAGHLLILIFFPFNLNLWVVIFYIYLSIWMEWRQVQYLFMRFLLERYYGKQSSFNEIEPIGVKENDLIYDALKKFQRNCKHLIHIEGGAALMGKLDENELLHAYFAEKRINARMKEIVYHDSLH